MVIFVAVFHWQYLRARLSRGAIVSPMSIHSFFAASAEAAEGAAEHSEINPYFYGGTALVVLLLALFFVTRLNLNR